jgi:hypothetical protein
MNSNDQEPTADKDREAHLRGDAGSPRELVLLAPIPADATDEALEAVAHQMIQLLRRRSDRQNTG